VTIVACNGIVLIIAVATASLGACVIWHEWTKIRPFVVVSEADTEPEDAGEEFDDTEAWDRGHDEWLDRAVGL
jgi:hypothetical protein